MAKSYVLMTVEIEDSVSPDTLRFGTGQQAIQRLQNLLKRAKSHQPRIRVGFCPLDDSGDLPQGSITIDASGGAPAVGALLAFAMFDASVTLVVGVDFPTSDDDAVLADGIASAITQHPQLGTVLEAVSDGVDTVTLTGRFPGALLEEITITASDMTTFTVAQIGEDVPGTDSDAAYFPVGKQHA